jgi:iron complex outermembrane recepter protein
MQQLFVLSTPCDSKCAQQRNHGGATARGARVTLISLAVSMALMAGAARAADADATPQASPAKADDTTQDTGALEEITVTARFRSESLQQAPISITAITGDQIEDRGITDVSDLTQSVPSTTLTKEGAQGGSALVAYIRGLGQTNYSLAFQPGVPIYVDGVYQPTAFGSLLTLGDVERVDVLRGPQGTLFGKNSEGGAITIQSVDPKGDGSGYLEAGAGSYDERRFRGAYDFSLIPGTLFVRVAAGSDKTDGYVQTLDYACEHPGASGTLQPSIVGKNCQTGSEGGVDDTYARIALKWLINDDATARLSASTIENHDEAVPGVPLIITNYPGSTLAAYNAAVAVPRFGIPISSNFITGNPYSDYHSYTNPLLGLSFSPYNTQNSWDITGKLDWNLPYGITFTSITGFKTLYGQIPDYNGGPITINMVDNTIHYQNYSEEDRFSGALFDKKLEWTAGLYYFHGKGEQYGIIDVATAKIGPYWGIYESLDNYTTSENESGFLHTVSHFTDKLSLEAGVRYSHDVFDYSYAGTNYAQTPANPIFTPGSPVFGAGQPLHIQSKDSRFDPKIALQYQWTDDFMTYAQYSTGFKGGGANPSPTTVSEATPFYQEELKAYEVGAKSQFFDHKVTLNVDAYLNDVTGLQLTGYASTGVGGTVTLNAGHADIKGVEAELQARPVQQLLLNVSADYLHFQYLSLGSAAYGPNNPSGLFLYDVAPFNPDFKANAGVQWTQQIGNLGSITPRLDFTYQSRVYFDPQNLLASSQGGYGLLNARLTYATPDAKWTAALQIDNALNKLYYLDMANSLKSFGFLTGEPAEPRTALVTLRYNF